MRVVYLLYVTIVYYMSEMFKRELKSEIYDRKDKLCSMFACHYNAINAYTQCGRGVLHKIKMFKRFKSWHFVGSIRYS